MSTENDRTLRRGFAVADGLFVAAIVLLTTTITPSFTPGTTATGGALLLISGAGLAILHVRARARSREAGARPRAGGRVVAQWSAELVVVAGAIAIILGGVPAVWAAVGAALVGAWVSYAVFGAGTDRNTEKVGKLT